ncbi:MAG TPA: ferrous iron transport protein A [Anaerolineales bacterium]|nr:ferrous iron transport protein A [Anaerolineae bacterium]HIQ00851.1 ferrous iron transport protein A [Anaerolineales bacterium]
MATDSRGRPPFTSRLGQPGTVPLSALRTGERGVVVQLAGGRGLLGRMTALGFTPGAEVTVIQNFGRGPLIARVRDARIALGRGEAGQIYVRRRSG